MGGAKANWKEREERKGIERESGGKEKEALGEA